MTISTSDDTGRKWLNVEPTGDESSASYRIFVNYAMPVSWEYSDESLEVSTQVMTLEFDIVEACLDGNVITVDEHSYESPQDYMIAVDDDLILDLPTVYDSASTEYGADFCGSITTTLSVEKDNVEVDASTFIVHSSRNGQIFVSTSDLTHRGAYTLYLTYTLADYPSVTLTEAFLTV